MTTWAALAVIAPVTTTAAEGDGDGCIWGRTWHDIDGSDTRDPAEPGVAGVLVELFDGDDSLIASATTGPGGRYRFTKLGDGSHRVRFSPPGAETFADPLVGGDPDVDSDAATTADPVLGVGVAAPVEVSGSAVFDAVDAGFQGTVADPSNGVGDLVWLDDGDGIQQVCEPGVAGVVVDLLDASLTTVATTTTDDRGRYFFEDPAPGDYQVRVVAPAGFDFTSTDAGGDDQIDSDLDATGLTAVFTFAADTQVIGIDGGLVLEPEPTTTTTPASSTTTTTTSTTTTTTPASTTTTTTTTTPASTTTTTTTTTARPTTTTAAPPTTTTTLDPSRAAWERYRASLQDASLSTPAGCDRPTGSDATEALPNIEVRCGGLEKGVPFRFTFAFGPPPTAASVTSEADAAPVTPALFEATGVPIQTTFESTLRLTYTTSQLQVEPTVVDATGTPGELELPIIVDGATDFPAEIRLTPLVAGEVELGFAIISHAEELTPKRIQVATGTITLVVAATPTTEPPTTTQEPPVTTEPPGTVPPATDDDDGGFVPWLLLALALVAVVGAGVTAFVILSRRSSARVLPAVAPIAAGTPSVFISYSRDDTDRIDLLKAALKRANLEPWVDTTAIAGGQRWKDEIVDGIESSRVIVLAISATSVRSEHVAAELDLGKQEGKRVLPVHLEPNVELSRHFRYDLSRIQHIEMFDDRDETIAVVVDAVRRLIDD